MRRILLQEQMRDKIVQMLNFKLKLRTLIREVSKNGSNMMLFFLIAEKTGGNNAILEYKSIHGTSRAFLS